MAQPVLYISGEALEMGGLPAITIERHNPLLSEGQQSYSYPFTLPRTPHNDRLLNFPARYARAARAQHNWTCTLVCGARVRVGKLVLNSIEASSYDCSMIYDTAELLDKTKGKKLGELTEWGGIPYGSPENAAADMRRLYRKEATVYPEATADLSIFPVLLDLKKFSRKDGVELEGERVACPMLNRPTKNSQHVLAGAEYDIVGDEMITDIPASFGIAPFLRATHVLKFIFEEKEGYTLDWGNRPDNPIAQLVLLHNRMDVLVNGYLQYKHLLPDCTTDDFVSCIEGMFCGKFVLNSITKVVTFRYFNDELDYEGARPALPSTLPPYPNTLPGGVYKQPKAELSPYLLNPPKLEFRPRSTIRLSMAKNTTTDVQGSWNSEFFNVNTFEEYFSKEAEEDYAYSNSITYPREEMRSSRMRETESKSSANTWNYYRGVEGGASVDVSLPCEFLITGSVYYSLDNTVESYGVGNIPTYGFGCTYVNSALVNSKKTSENAKTPLAFACENKRNTAGSPFLPQRLVLNGTTVGNSWYRHNFGYPEHVINLRLHRPDGLFNVYHSLRDRMLRSGGYKLTVRIDSSLVVNENEQYTLNGQKVLVESVTETLGEYPTQEVVLQTIKDYEEDGSNA